MSEETSNAAVIELTADIVAAFVSNNSLPPSELPNVIRSIADALRGVDGSAETAKAEELKPFVPIRKSITPDFLICLEDGRKFKSLKRHLATKYNMSPQQYRAKWGLATDYPMVAPNYAAARSELAKAAGLGQGGRGKAPATAPAKVNGKGKAKPAK